MFPFEAERWLSVLIYDEDNIIKRAQNNDVGAFDELYRHTADDVYGYICYITKNAEVAKDLVTDTFLRAMDKIGTFRRESDFKVWVIGIAHNVCREYFKSKKRRAKTEVTLAWGEVDESSLHGLQQNCYEMEKQEKEAKEAEYSRLRECMNDLPNEQKEVLRLRFIEDISIKDVAKYMGKTESAIKNLQYRAFLTIKEEFASKE